MTRSKLRETPNQQFLQTILRYCPESGKLFWNVDRSSNARKDNEAGSIDSKGYRFIRINKTPYRTHRLIWKMVTGMDAGESVDHINGDKMNNRFINLRSVSHSMNLKNCKQRKDNTSGVTGISWNPRRSVWRSYVNIGGKMKELGNFKNKQEAVDCRNEFSKKYGFHSNHGRIVNV